MMLTNENQNLSSEWTDFKKECLFLQKKLLFFLCEVQGRKGQDGIHYTGERGVCFPLYLPLAMT